VVVSQCRMCLDHEQVPEISGDWPARCLPAKNRASTATRRCRMGWPKTKATLPCEQLTPGVLSENYIRT
jgi:hypothetical protein